MQHVTKIFSSPWGGVTPCAKNKCEKKIKERLRNHAGFSIFISAPLMFFEKVGEWSGWPEGHHK